LEIAQEADKVVLRTVGAGQVQINDEKVSQAVLRVGDEVRLGSVLWSSGVALWSSVH
jgi:uncharacterized protein